jgi:hypothetical protein
MRRLVVLCGFLWCTLCVSPLAGQTHPAAVSPRTNPALEQFKSLAGEWDGKDEHGTLIHVTYEALGSGVVMERFQPENESAMVTMYSLDGDHIVAIHFCSTGNQPILKTGPLSSATGKYDFSLERTYGMRTPEELHMTELLFTMGDKDHIVQTWTYVDHGKRSTSTFTLARKKN